MGCFDEVILDVAGGEDCSNACCGQGECLCVSSGSSDRHVMFDSELRSGVSKKPV